MNVQLLQTTRVGRLATVLGPERLVLLRFGGSDAVDGLFEYHADALSLTPDVDFDSLLGTHATVELQTIAHGARHFDGLVTRAEWIGATLAGNQYRLTLRPWFWLAGRRRNLRIFHNKTVVQILTEVFGDWAHLGDPAFSMKLTGNYPVLEYTVQYRESDLDFATRMMERFAINHHFTHKAGSHTLVLTDAMDSFPAIPGGSREVTNAAGQHRFEAEHFDTWSPSRGMTTGAVRLTDYNFKKPSAAMEAFREGDAAFANGKVESYDWPGDYLEQDEGRGVASRRVVQERGADHRHRATGDVMSLQAGMRVTLTGAQIPGVKEADYLCLGASHSYAADGYGTGDMAAAGDAYRGEYAFIPVTAPFGPERRTTVPVIHGPQTAVVVGEGEIDCDEHGRILVRFHWDLKGAHSMRCRVSQSWASQGWGGIVIPRIGMEVVVEFLEGDPDKPLVTGCVYNGKNKVPYALPEHKTKSVFRSNTHQGEGFNELTFEDQKGAEKIYLHAERDQEVHVENNRAKRVDRNQSESVGHNKSIEIGNNHHEIIGGNMTLMVGPNKLQSAVTSAFQKFTGKLGDLAGRLGLPDLLNMGEGNLIIGVGKNKAETVMVSSSEIVGGAKTLIVGSGYQVSVQGMKNESVMIGSYEEIGQNKVVVAGKKIEFVCGKSLIQMNEDGTIRIEGINLLIGEK